MSAATSKPSPLTRFVVRSHSVLGFAWVDDTKLNDSTLMRSETVAEFVAERVERSREIERLANDPHAFAKLFERAITGTTRNGFRSRKGAR